MAYPGVIERPLLPDEFSIFFESRDPIPLGRMATLLQKIENEIRPIVEVEDLFLELSEYASGSGEPRFRIVGPGRVALREAQELQRRDVEAAERQADVTDKWGSRNFVGSVFVGPVVAAIAASLVSGPLNPSARNVVYDGDVTNVYVRTLDDLVIIPRREIEEGRNSRKRVGARATVAAAEHDRLFQSLGDGTRVRLAGRVEFHRHGMLFRTIAGNSLSLVSSKLTERLREHQGPIVIEAVVRATSKSLAVEPVDLITGFDDL